MFDAETGSLEGALEELAGEDRSGWPGAAHSAGLLRLIAAREALEVELVRAVADWDGAGAWADDGAASAVGWLRSRGRLSDAAAKRLATCARLTREHEPTALALRAGRLPVENLRLIGLAIADRRDAFLENPNLLLDAAAEFAPTEFATFAKRWREAADDALSRADAQAQNDAQHFHASRTLGGMVAVNGLLAPDEGAVLLTALDAYEPSDPTASPGRRRAAALAAIAAAAIAHYNQDASVPIGLDVVADLRTFAPDAHAYLTTMRSDLDRVGPIAPALLERLACDCSVGHVILRGDSEVLNLGRRTRVVSRAQRRALVHRDGGCAFPGCDRPHRWCDAHHLIPWQHGGPTDLDNLALLCRRHHVMCHEGGWQLTREAGGNLVAVPPGPPEPGPPRPRGPDDLTLAA